MFVTAKKKGLKEGKGGEMYKYVLYVLTLACMKTFCLTAAWLSEELAL